MREIVYTRSFRRDLKRESKGRYANVLEEDLLFVVKALAEIEQEIQKISTKAA